MNAYRANTKCLFKYRFSKQQMIVPYIKAIINQEPCAVPVIRTLGANQRYQSSELWRINLSSQWGNKIRDQHPSRITSRLQKCPSLLQSFLQNSIFHQNSREETTKNMATNVGHIFANQSLNGSQHNRTAKYEYPQCLCSI